MSTKRDYYEILGINRNATENEIKNAYRKLAKKYHPDANPGNEEAEVKFKEAAEAYSILSDSEKRRKYDQFGTSAFEGANTTEFDFTNFDMGDIFSDLFGTMFNNGFRQRGNEPIKGKNTYSKLNITLTEACFGVQKEIEITLKDTCETCNGSGAAPGTELDVCTKCKGTGRIISRQKSLFGIIQNTQTCPDCHGSGKIIKHHCSDCKGTGVITKKTMLSINIPAGIDDGQHIRIQGKGEPGNFGGPNGDLLIEINIKKDKDFTRQGLDIYSNISLKFTDAILGAELEIPTIHGPIKYTIKPGTQTNTIIKLKEKGVPNLNNKNIYGDHYVTFIVELPTKINKEQKELLEKLDESLYNKNRTKTGLFKRKNND